MNTNYNFHIRVTGILIENNKILLVKQKLSASRNWSLPGGRLEIGESLEQGITREFKEETGLSVELIRLLYVCDVSSSCNQVLHITFLLKRIHGALTIPSNEFDENPIHDVRFVPIAQLTDYGFSEQFQKLVSEGFPEYGSYMGDKENIGLGI